MLFSPWLSVLSGHNDYWDRFIDGSFVPAKKGVLPLAGQNAAKVAGSWQLRLLPVFLSPASASPHEVKLVETLLSSRFISSLPEKLIGDKAYDSDKLDAELLKRHHIEMTAPHRRNRTKPKTQDGRKLRRYKRRWKFCLASKLQTAGCPI